MKAKAIQRNIHISARKANLVCDLVRYKSVREALIILENVEKKMGQIVKKLLNSAVANATNNHQMAGEHLYIYAITANQGATIKRSLPRAKGSAHMMRKRHSHLEITLSDDPKQKEKDLLALRHKKVATPKATTSADKKIVSKIDSVKVKPVEEKPVVKLQSEITKEGDK
jgi:ribosomal protein L22